MNTSDATVLVPGHARGKPMAIAPLSFWGGYDAARGVIVDATHPAYQQSLASRILVMPRARGSSSSSSVLAEALRNGTGPSGIVLAERDLIVCIGAITANELYALSVPVVMCDEAAFDAIAASHAFIEIDARDPHRTASIRLNEP
jgi:uncharacterized protein